MKTNQAYIFAQEVGSRFGVCARVKVGGEIIHTTETFPFGFAPQARTAAAQWAANHGYSVDQALLQPPMTVDEIIDQHRRIQQQSMPPSFDEIIASQRRQTEDE